MSTSFLNFFFANRQRPILERKKSGRGPILKTSFSTRPPSVGKASSSEDEHYSELDFFCKDFFKKNSKKSFFRISAPLGGDGAEPAKKKKSRNATASQSVRMDSIRCARTMQQENASCGPGDGRFRGFHAPNTGGHGQFRMFYSIQSYGYRTSTFFGGVVNFSRRPSLPFNLRAKPEVVHPTWASSESGSVNGDLPAEYLHPLVAARLVNRLHPLYFLQPLGIRFHHFLDESFGSWQFAVIAVQIPD